MPGKNYFQLPAQARYFNNNNNEISAGSKFKRITKFKKKILIKQICKITAVFLNTLINTL